MSLAKGKLSAILFVDDTDVIQLETEKNETAFEVQANIQASVMRWGNFLTASGGALKVWSCLFGHFDPSPSNVHNLSMPLS